MLDLAVRGDEEKVCGPEPAHRPGPNEFDILVLVQTNFHQGSAMVSVEQFQTK